VTKEELDDIRAAFEHDYDPYFWRKMGHEEPSDPFRLAITHVGKLLTLIREAGISPSDEPPPPTEQALIELLMEARRNWICDERWIGGETGSMQPTGEALRAFGKRIDIAVAPYLLLTQLCGASKTGVHVRKPNGVCVHCGSQENRGSAHE